MLIVLLDAAAGCHGSVMDDDVLVAEILDQIQSMGGHDHRALGPGVLGQVALHLVAHDGVDGVKGLVQDHDLGPVDDACAEGHLLLGAQRASAELLVQMLLELEPLGKGHDPLVEHLAGHIVQGTHQAQILISGHFQVQVAEVAHDTKILGAVIAGDGNTIHFYGTALLFQKTHQNTDEGSLTGGIATQDRKDVMIADLEAHISQDLLAGVGESEIIDRQHTVPLPSDSLCACSGELPAAGVYAVFPLAGEGIAHMVVEAEDLSAVVAHAQTGTLQGHRHGELTDPPHMAAVAAAVSQVDNQLFRSGEGIEPFKAGVLLHIHSIIMYIAVVHVLIQFRDVVIHYISSCDSVEICSLSRLQAGGFLPAVIYTDARLTRLYTT